MTRHDLPLALHCRSAAALVSLVAVLALAGCSDDAETTGPDGGPDPDGSNGDGIIRSIPVVEGLTGDADNHDRLFFNSLASGQEGLYAVHPDQPDAPELVDDRVPDGLGGYMPTFQPLYRFGWTAGAEAATGVRLDGIVYRYLDDAAPRAARVSADPEPATVEPQQVTTSSSLCCADPVVARDPMDPDDTFMVFLSPVNIEQLRAGDDGTVAPVEHDDGYSSFIGVHDPSTLAPVGWLVIDDDMDRQVRVIDTSGTVIGEPTAGEDVSSDGVALLMTHFGVLPDGSRYLLATIDGGGSEIWRYEPGAAGAPGQLSRVRDGTGAPLDPPFGQSLGLRWVVDGDVVYFASHQLYRVQGDTATLLAAHDRLHANDLLFVDGDTVVWSPGEDVIEAVSVTDGSITAIDDDAWTDRIESPVPNAVDGWIYYTRTENRGGTRYTYAVAYNLRNGARIELEGARWAGASTSGHIESGGPLAPRFELSEVFLVLDETRELAAVRADDPAAGMVILGELPAGTDRAVTVGVAPGPHRLLQAYEQHPTQSTGRSHFQVVYANTRVSGSLHTVSFAPSDDHPMETPVEGF